jgi:hypothetical protein
MSLLVIWIVVPYVLKGQSAFIFSVMWYFNTSTYLNPATSERERERVSVHGDQKVSVYLMITIQKVTSNVQSVPRQSPNTDTRPTLTPSVIPNSNYVITVSDGNCLKYFACLFLVQ